jgi:hypothetical protein
MLPSILSAPEFRWAHNPWTIKSPTNCWLASAWVKVEQPNTILGNLTRDIFENAILSCEACQALAGETPSELSTMLLIKSW